LPFYIGLLFIHNNNTYVRERRKLKCLLLFEQLFWGGRY